MYVNFLLVTFVQFFIYPRFGACVSLWLIQLYWKLYSDLQILLDMQSLELIITFQKSKSCTEKGIKKANEQEKEGDMIEVLSSSSSSSSSCSDSDSDSESS